MAARLDSASEYLSRTTGTFNNNAAYTVMLLFRQPTGTQTNCAAFVTTSRAGSPSGSAYEGGDYLFTTGGGDSFRCGSFVTGNGAETDSGDLLSENTWYWLVMRRTSATAITFGYAPVGGSMTWDTNGNTNSVGSRGATVAELIGALDVGGATNFDIEHLKIWSTNLTDGQVTSELAYGNPQLATNLHTYTTFASDLNSTNGSNWTATGTVGFTAGSGIATNSSSGTIAIAQASYAFTPQNVTTKPAFGQTSGQASYAFTPQNVTTSRTTASIMTAAQASYAFTPQDVTTIKAATYFTTIAQASYAFTPQDVTTSRTRTIDVYWLPIVGNAGYGIEWGTTSGGPYSTGSGTVGTDVLTYGITGLAERTTYFWRVRALPSGDWSAEGVFTTSIDPTIAAQASYSFTPQNVTTSVGFGQSNAQASYSFTPQNVTTKPAFGQSNAQASYSFTPQNVTTKPAFGQTSDQASYAFTPQNIVTSTIKAYVMAVGQAGYTLTPQNVLTVAFLSRILAVGYALYSFTPYGVAIPGEVTPGDAVRRRNNRALAARLWRNKQELARKLFGM